MKKILITTDFSATANNAVKYAASLAKATGASLTLLNVYHVPVIASDTPVIPPIGLQEIEDESQKALERLKKEIESSSTGVAVETVCMAGFATDEILERSTDFDLIIMGIKGGGKISKLLGSTATAVSKQSKTPVLIVPAEATFKAPERIAFAFDYKEISNANCMNLLLDIAKKFNGKIYVLKVTNGEHKPSIEKALAGMQINDILEETNHVVSFKKDDDIAQGIEQYITKHRSDMLVMIKREYGFFESLFKESYTKTMAFHTHIPLLILHD